MKGSHTHFVWKTDARLGCGKPPKSFQDVGKLATIKNITMELPSDFLELVHIYFK